ncbi:MAG: TusE/DsrC/DsvC family sulfur relay protein [Halieaceae bacterium]
MVSETALEELCDENGFLRQREAWSQDVAEAFAAIEGVTLTSAHWEVLSLLQEFFEAFGDSPANRALVNYVKQRLGADKGNSLYLMGLFPGSPARVGSRIAGLPKPKNCL